MNITKTYRNSAGIIFIKNDPVPKISPKDYLEFFQNDVYGIVWCRKYKEMSYYL